MVDEPMVSAAEVARLAGVERAAVSNWRRRHSDFPEPVGAGKFRLSEVEAWLHAQGKAREQDPHEELWRAVEAGSDLAQRVADVATTLAERGEGRRLNNRTRAALARANNDPRVTVERLIKRLLTSQQRQHLVTPGELASLMVELGDPEGKTVLDPACGPGTLLVTARDRGATLVAGEEIDQALAQLAEARVALTGSRHQKGWIIPGDTLRADGFQNQEFDVVLCDPPFGYRDWGHEELAVDSRWVYGLPVKSEPELAWVQHCLAHAKPGGRVVVVLPAGVASRRAGRAIRAAMIRNGVLRTVIALPAGALRSTGISVHVWVLHNPPVRLAIKNDPILLIDHTDARPARRGQLDWPTIAEAVLAAWREFTATGRIDRIPGRQCVINPIDVLDEHVDLTPAAHNPPLPPAVANDDLARQHADLIAELRALPELFPEVPRPTTAAHPRHTLAELAKAGALTIYQQPLTKLHLTETGTGQLVLTGRDVADGVVPALRLPEPIDNLITLRAGDLVVSQLAATPHPIPQIVTEQSAADLVLGPNLHLIRVSEARIDVHYLAGILATTVSTSATTSGIYRLDLRRVTVPVPDLETQRRQGVQFRNLAEFRQRLADLTKSADALTIHLTNAIANGSD